MERFENLLKEQVHRESFVRREDVPDPRCLPEPPFDDLVRAPHLDPLDLHVPHRAGLLQSRSKRIEMENLVHDHGSVEGEGVSEGTLVVDPTDFRRIDLAGDISRSDRFPLEIIQIEDPSVFGRGDPSSDGGLADSRQTREQHELLHCRLPLLGVKERKLTPL